MVRVVGIDPSGNYKEGKGTTGVALLEDGELEGLYDINAKNYATAEDYWIAHTHVINSLVADIVVMEGYRLYNHQGMKASSQANSELETPQLIGAIRMWCRKNNIPLFIQYASEVKSRWSDDVLVHKGILKRGIGRITTLDGKTTNLHKRDALRHALHFWRYNKKDVVR